MKIAIPLARGVLCVHFGRCDSFAFIEVGADGQGGTCRSDIIPPAHSPGLYPAWLVEQGITNIIAGGMGERALELCAEKGIDVLVGAPVDTPEALAQRFLVGTMPQGRNSCNY